MSVQPFVFKSLADKMAIRAAREQLEDAAQAHYQVIQSRKKRIAIFYSGTQFRRVRRDCARFESWSNDPRFELVGVYTQAVTYQELLEDFEAAIAEVRT